MLADAQAATSLAGALDDAREVLRAWRWRHTVLAILIGTATLVAMGTPLAPSFGERQYLVPWLYNVLQFGFPLVFAVAWADRCVDRGQRPIAVYGLAVIAVVVVGTWPIARLLWPVLGKAPYWNIANDMWLMGNALLFHGLGVAAYAQWRSARLAQARLQQGEQAHAQQQQALVAAQLLALQARVDPQLLKQALHRVDAALAADDAETADKLLADLIRLLRALQPAVHARSSSLGRELDVVQAYALVSQEPGLQAPWLQIDASDTARRMSCAPMILLPLLRQLAREPGWQWQVKAVLQMPSRLVLTLRAPRAGVASTLAALQALDIALWQRQLRDVHGADSVLRLAHEAHQTPHLHIEFDAVPAHNVTADQSRRGETPP